MAFTWEPKRGLKECADLLVAPGSPFETERKIIGSREINVYKHQPPSLKAVWLATKVFAEAEYLVFENERYTYNQAHGHVKAAIALLQSHGVKKGDKIVIFSRNYPLWIWTFWASQCLGCVTVAVNAWNPLPAARASILDTEPRLIFVDQERAQLIAPILKEVMSCGAEAIYVYRPTKWTAGFRNYEEAVQPHLGRDVGYPDMDIFPEDHCSIFFTSGTQAMPKGVLSTQRQVLTLMTNKGVAPARAALRRGESLPRPDPSKPQRCILIGTPLFHVTGIHTGVILSTSAGGKIVLMPKFVLAKALQLLVEEKVTSTGGVPHLALEMIQGLGSRTDHCLETFSFGGGPAPARMPNLVRENLGTRVAVTQAYGSTETNGTAVIFQGEDYLQRPTSTGLPCPSSEMKICDLESDTMKELPTGQAGEIWLKGASVAEGYYKNEKATSEAFRPDGWYRTGDIGYVDTEGFLYVSDRAKEMIIRGGENISAGAVENVFFNHPAVQDCAVLPLPDDKLSEVVGAILILKVEARGKISEAELKAFAGQHLARHEIPEWIWIREEPFPRNASSKVLKNQLKPEIQERWRQMKTGTKRESKL